MTEPKTAVDQIEAHLEVAKRDAAAYKILHESGGAELYENIGIAKFAEFLRRVGTFAQFEALRQIIDAKSYRLARNARMDRPCKDEREFLEAVGFPIDRYLILKREVADFSRATARILEESGVSKRIRRGLLSAPTDVKKSVRELVAANPDGDKKMLAEEIASIFAAYAEKKDAECRDADDRANNAECAKTAAEMKADRAGKTLANTHAALEQLKTERDALRTELDTPDFARGDAAAIHKRIRDEQMQFSARVAYLEKHIFAPLVHWSEEGKPNHDLNRLALMILVDTLTALSHTLSGALFAFDPQQTNSDYTALWLFRSLHLAAATEADVADHEDLLAKLQEAARKSANDPEGQKA